MAVNQEAGLLWRPGGGAIEPADTVANSPSAAPPGQTQGEDERVGVSHVGSIGTGTPVLEREGRSRIGQVSCTPVGYDVTHSVGIGEDGGGVGVASHCHLTTRALHAGSGATCVSAPAVNTSEMLSAVKC